MKTLFAALALSAVLASPAFALAVSEQLTPDQLNPASLNPEPSKRGNEYPISNIQHPTPKEGKASSYEPLNPEPFLLEPASAEQAVEVPHKSTGRKIAEYLRDKGLSENMIIVAISTLPIVELRGAIPVGHWLLPDTDPDTRIGADDLRRSARIFLWAVLGNMLPVPFILLLLGPVSSLCMKVPIGKKFFDWLFARTRHKTASVEKYETLGLTVFVAIPLPVTGAWTGSMAAFLMGLSFPHAMVSIFLGVLIAGVIMTTLSLLGWIGAAIAGIVLISLFVSVLAKALKKEAPAAPESTTP